MSTDFQVGDVVEFGGILGKVVQIDATDCDPEFSLVVSFEGDPDLTHFTFDGRYFKHHTKPLLILVSRPKKKVTKTLVGWVNLYSDMCPQFFLHKNLADDESSYCANFRNTVKVTGTYEVEE